MKKIKTMKSVWKFLSILLLAVSLHLAATSAAQLTTAGAEAIIKETTSSNWDDNVRTTPTLENIDQPATVNLSFRNLALLPLPGDYSNDGNGEELCPPGVSCDKRDCNEGFCGCSEGWLPPDCEIQCPPDCAASGTCIPDSTRTNQSTCACDPTSRYVPGQGCVEKPTDVTEPPYIPGPVGGLYPGSRENIFDPNENKLAPFDDRFCLPGYVCIHGNCSKTEESAAGCACEPGFTGELCEISCKLDCGPNGDCVYNRFNNTLECSCHDGFVGTNCTEIWIPSTKEGIDQKALMLRFAAALVLLPIFLLVVVAVILYRRGNIPLMKIMYWVKPFEEDDDKQFDVFVSFASSEKDITFVKQDLVPHLEGRMNFNVCVHLRDFLPGRYISDNIVDAIKQSRRTIIIVSTSFVSSGWCKFEYQMAIQEMLTEKHRVLPIILGDISSVNANIDDTLKSILKTVTWLEYPEKTASKKDFEKFWTRLYLSLPKKRASQLESGKHGPCPVRQGGQVCLPTLPETKNQKGSVTLTNSFTKIGQVQGKSEALTFQRDLNDISGLDVNNVKETRSETGSKRGLIESSYL